MFGQPNRLRNPSETVGEGDLPLLISSLDGVKVLYGLRLIGQGPLVVLRGIATLSRRFQTLSSPSDLRRCRREGSLHIGIIIGDGAGQLTSS